MPETKEVLSDRDVTETEESSQAWCLTPAISVLKQLRQEEGTCWASLGYLVSTNKSVCHSEGRSREIQRLKITLSYTVSSRPACSLNFMTAYLKNKIKTTKTIHTASTLRGLVPNTRISDNLVTKTKP